MFNLRKISFIFVSQGLNLIETDFGTSFGHIFFKNFADSS